eukprot:3904571-Rhodomonas_salina.1
MLVPDLPPCACPPHAPPHSLPNRLFSTARTPSEPLPGSSIAAVSSSIAAVSTRHTTTEHVSGIPDTHSRGQYWISHSAVQQSPGQYQPLHNKS